METDALELGIAKREKVWELMADAHRAIGRLITTWSLVEGALAVNVGLLLAFDKERNEINRDLFANAVGVCSGTGAAALINQAVYLTQDKATISFKIKAAGDDLANRLKLKRDDLAHMITTSDDGVSVNLFRLSYGKSKPHVDKIWTVKQIDAWSEDMAAKMQEIGDLIYEYTGCRVAELEA